MTHYDSELSVSEWDALFAMPESGGRRDWPSDAPETLCVMRCVTQGSTKRKCCSE